MMSRLSSGLLLALALAGCRTVAPAGVEVTPRRTPPPVPARALMDVCWSVPGPSPQKVRLTLLKEAGRLKDVFFQTEGGAPNTVGRCLQQIAWIYPWEGSIPDVLEIGPPEVRASGWVHLAYFALLGEGSYAPERGVLQPGPLVRACLEQGMGYRRLLRFRVQPQPVRISVLLGEREEGAVTDPERCVEAVLAATVYPGTRAFELSFGDLRGAPTAAPAREVAHYFGPPGPPEPEGSIDPLAAKERIGLRQPAVSACWESALARRAGLAGARTLRIRVGPEGEVIFSQVVANRSDQPREAVDYLLDRCLVSAVSTLRFPPPGGAGGEFAYSWVFALR